MSNVQTVATRATTGVDEKRIPFFVMGKDFIQVAMAEKKTSSEPPMWFMACQTLKAL